MPNAYKPKSQKDKIAFKDHCYINNYLGLLQGPMDQYILIFGWNVMLL